MLKRKKSVRKGKEEICSTEKKMLGKEEKCSAERKNTLQSRKTAPNRENKLSVEKKHAQQRRSTKVRQVTDIYIGGALYCGKRY